MYILVELFHQVAVAGGKFLLLLERNHHPVSLVYAVEGLLGLHVEVVVGDLLPDVGYLVGCGDGTTHIDRLAEHDASCPHIAGIRAEGIYDALADGIALLLDGTALLLQESTYLLSLFWGKKTLAYQFGHHVVGIV